MDRRDPYQYLQIFYFKKTKNGQKQNCTFIVAQAHASNIIFYYRSKDSVRLMYHLYHITLKLAQKIFKDILIMDYMNIA